MNLFIKKIMKINNIDNIDFEIKDYFDITAFNFDFIFSNINLNVFLELSQKIDSVGTIMIIYGILNSDEKVLARILKKQKKIIKNIYRKNE